MARTSAAETVAKNKEKYLAPAKAQLDAAKTPEDRYALLKKFASGENDKRGGAANEVARMANSELSKINLGISNTIQNDPNNATLQQEIAKYNNGEPVNPVVKDYFEKYNKYFEQGQAAPGKLNIDLMQDAEKQWTQDMKASPGMEAFSKALTVAASVGMGMMTGGAATSALGATGGAMAGGAVGGGVNAFANGGSLEDIVKGAGKGALLAGGTQALASGGNIDFGGGVQPVPAGGMASTGSIPAGDVLPNVTNTAGTATNAAVNAGLGNADIVNTALGNAGVQAGVGASGLMPNVAALAGSTTAPNVATTPQPNTTPAPSNTPKSVSDLAKTYIPGVKAVDEFLTNLPGTKEDVNGVIGVGSGVYDLATDKPGQVAAQADPFGSQRARYAGDLASFSSDPSSNKFFADLTQRVSGPAAQGTAGVANYSVSNFTGGLASGNFIGMLTDLLNNPSSVTSLPGYDFLQKQGIQGVERTLAAQGRTVSGNEMLALQEQNQGLANQQYLQQLSTLSPLAQAQAGEAQNIWSTTNQIGANQAATNAQLATQTSLANAAAEQQQKQFAADLLSRQYNTQQGQLGYLAGAGGNPAAATQLGQEANQKAWDAIGQGAGAVYTTNKPGSMQTTNPSGGLQSPYAR